MHQKFEISKIFKNQLCTENHFTHINRVQMIERRDPHQDVFITY